jgi:hypothetical protein
LGYLKPRNARSGGGAGTFTLEDMRSEEKDPVWSAHYDEAQGEVFYYNRVTKDSQWERPSNFDGYDIMTGQAAVRLGDQWEDYERTFGDKFSKASDLITSSSH